MGFALSSVPIEAGRIRVFCSSCLEFASGEEGAQLAPGLGPQPGDPAPDQPQPAGCWRALRCGISQLQAWQRQVLAERPAEQTV